MITFDDNIMFVGEKFDLLGLGVFGIFKLDILLNDCCSAPMKTNTDITNSGKKSI